MHSMIQSIHLLLIVVAALLVMFNLEAGKRLLIRVVAFILLAPLILGLLAALFSDVGDLLARQFSHAGFAAARLLALVILALLAWAFLRFLLRRRRLQGLLGQPQTSLKRRVDRS